MRKHFLLFLMALLPMVVFAADLDVSKFTAANISFGTTDLGTVSNTQGLVQGEEKDYVVIADRFFTSNTGAGETLVSEGGVNNLSKANVGTYYIKVVGKNAYAGGTIYVSFHINGIEIKATDIAAIDPQPYSGSVIKPEPVVTVGGNNLVKGKDYDVAWSNNTNVGATATVTVTGKGNYSGEVNKNFNIVQKLFNATNITVTVSNNEVTYDGTNTQKATVVVADKTLGTLKEGTDYTVAYEDEHKNAGEYAITVTGKGNYTGDDIVAAKKLIIGKATVLVAPKATKVYDGTKDLPAVTQAALQYTGFVDATTANDVDITGTTWESDANLKKDVKADYLLKIKVNNLSTTGNNYTFVPQNGTLSITQRNVDIYANDQTIAYGAPIATDAMTVQDLSGSITNWTVAGKPKEGDLAAIKRAVIVYEEGGKLKVKANDAASAADKTALANYKPAYNKNVGADKTGTLNTTKGTITIALNSNVKLTKVYDGEKAAIAEDVTNAANLNIIGELVAGDELVLTGLKATVAENTGAVNADPGYKVTLSGATLSKNADKYNINYVTTYYKVTQKPLTVTIKPQTVTEGATITKVFDETLFTMDGLVAKDGKKDDIFKLKLADAVVDGTKIKTGSITGNHINLVAKDGKAAIAANYSIAVTTGKLVVAGAETVVLNDAEDLSKLAKADNKVVTFSSRELKKGVWTSMVLPFATTVRQVSNALGYAIVDMLDADANSSDMNFKIHMGTIPAYTPFLVKVDEDINMNTVEFGDGTESVDIVKFEGEVAKNLTQSNKDYNFIGKLDLAAIGSDFWAVGSKMTKENFEFNKYAAGKKVAPMRAYITAKSGVSAAPTIYIEEADGTVTAINAISADGVAIEKANAEGWYTLQGVKLDSAPTQKGIYIYNGKKVAIK